jgi:hypothetical protein
MGCSKFVLCTVTVTVNCKSTTYDVRPYTDNTSTSSIYNCIAFVCLKFETQSPYLYYILLYYILLSLRHYYVMYVLSRYLFIMYIIYNIIWYYVLIIFCDCDLQISIFLSLWPAIQKNLHTKTSSQNTREPWYQGTKGTAFGARSS